jgi:hypothetical protein
MLGMLTYVLLRTNFSAKWHMYIFFLTPDIPLNILLTEYGKYAMVILYNIPLYGVSIDIPKYIPMFLLYFKYQYSVSVLLQYL